MKYAVQIPNFGLVGEARILADLAALAEEHHWDAMFIWDHLQWPNSEPCVDPWVALTAMAMQTEKLTIGPMVTALPRRDIGKLARETISVDRLSGGRLKLGAGLGWQTIPEYGGFGHEQDLRIRAAMLDEGLEVLTALWSGQPVSHSGKYYRVECEAFNQPVQSPRIPIWVGGLWPSVKPFRRAAKWDGILPISKKALEGKQISPEELIEIRDQLEEFGADLSDYDISIAGTTQCAEDNEIPKAYANVGATWWIESGMAWLSSLEDLESRIRRGPPAI
ncbi:MAG: LLM class flavin-dependent oxidoreductase [Rhodospirillaceae bacterium]|nr:LLM class flavin-dependent oxidoreductase [Rhodospirillaceae bacterium]MBT4487457.1 LLM class flavin-dependent oxidoreductase [Rhodospirillaceae bacterium]MBT5192858.1 LLM class flavin-dependent oxidoreductase [Rhodospirillaceae bacterium]MBT6430626.1 LLM class flavin-dependent oxidoreductase [Rhodospirillaceae bacterium]